MKPDAKKRKENRISRKREEIITIAENIARVNGFNDLNFNSIADQMEVSSNALYYYFNTIESVLIEIGIRSYRTLTNMFKNCINDEISGLLQILKMGKEYYKFATKYPHYREVFHHIPSLSDKSKDFENVESEFAKIWIDSVQNGQEDGSIRNDINGIVLALILGKISSGFIDELQHSKSIIDKLPFNMEEIVNTTLEILKKGLEPDNIK